MAKISTYLGIDFGQAKIGLAIADEETKMAFTFDTLKNNKEFLNNLKEIVGCENVKTIVIGMTSHQKDPESGKKKEHFADMLKKELTGIEIVFHEEMFTTKMAQDNLKQHGKKGIAKNDDQEAARIILQSWLDKNKLFEKSVEALKRTHIS
jgi:putative Holliday junction resolvase